MVTEEARARFVVIERLTAAQAHLGRAIADAARGIKPHDGIAAMQAAIGEAHYWMGRADEAAWRESERDEASVRPGTPETA